MISKSISKPANHYTLKYYCQMVGTLILIFSAAALYDYWDKYEPDEVVAAQIFGRFMNQMYLQETSHDHQQQ